MNKYVFLFAIGPVQSFIAQARRTQDLYAGSFLLSHLIGSAMDKLESFLNGRCEFIFPHKDIKSRPNRFIATIETDNPEQLAKSVEKRVREKFKSIADGLYNKYENNGKKPENFDEQINNFLDIHWVVISYEKENYAEKYEKIEKLLGAVKNVRTFQQLKETGRKCSLCGERNVLFYRLTDEEKKNGGLKVRQDGLLKKLYVEKRDVVFFEPEKESDKLKMQKGEGLCAVCFTKRFADKYFERGYESNYPSTAEVALIDSLAKLGSGLLDEYKRIFDKNFDTELYYEDNLTKKYFEKYNYPVEKLEKARAKLGKIHKEAQEKGLKNCKYYALIMLDGDNMGKWLSGEFLEDKDKKELRGFHKKLSGELGAYAKNVENIIEKPEGKSEGKLVYAGGDDVMAFVNLKYLFDVLTKLREKFPKFEEAGFDIKDNHESTASAGIVIAHYKTPLSEVLKWARKMEHEAKDKGDRDAFAIAALKHSGEINKTVWKWGVDNKNKSLKIKLLENLIEELNDEKEGFSSTFIKNLNIEFQKIGEIKNDLMLKTELKRLLDRSSQIKGDKGKKKQKVQEWQEKLFNLYIDAQTKDNFLSFLNIADFLARKVTR